MYEIKNSSTVTDNIFVKIKLCKYNTSFISVRELFDIFQKFIVNFKIIQ